MSKIPYRIYLSEDEIPKYWYNLKAVMKEPPPPFLNPATLEPCTAGELEQVFCRDLVEQELNTTDLYIEIPPCSSSTKCSVHRRLSEPTAWKGS